MVASILVLILIVLLGLGIGLFLGFYVLGPLLTDWLDERNRGE